MLPTKRYTPEDYLKLAWRWKWALALIPLVMLTLTSVVAARLPDRYRSETLILVVPQQVPTDYVKATVTANMQDRLTSIGDQILSRTRLEQIVNEFKLYPEIRQRRPMEDTIVQMRGDITIEVVKGESFRISYQASDPDIAKRVTERLAAFFIEENLRDREVMASGTSAFLESQLEDARRRLVEREKLIEEFSRNYSGELPSQLQSNLQTIQNKQFQLQSVREALNRDQDRKILLERQLADLTAEPAIAATPTPQNTESADPAVQLEAARNTLKALQTRLKDDHPDVIRLKRVIATLETKVASAPTPGAAPAEPGAVPPVAKKRTRDLQLEIDNVARQIDFGQRQQQSLESEIAEYQHRVENAPARESQLVALTRDYDTLQNIYRSLLAKREDSKIAENLERRQIGEQFKVVDPARRPERPSSPDRLRINLGGLAVGFVIALGLIALFEYRDKSVRTEQDIQRVLRIPVLAVVPDIQTRGDRLRIRVWRIASASAGLSVVIACMVVLSHTLRGIR